MIIDNSDNSIDTSEELCGLFDKYLAPKRRRPNTCRKIKINTTALVNDIRHFYPNMLVSVFNVADTGLLRNFIKTFGTPELYVEDGYAGPSASSKQLMKANGCDEVVKFAANHFAAFPDYVMTTSSVQLRRRGESRRSYSILRVASRYTNLKTMQDTIKYSTMLMVINEQNLIEAVYGGADFSDPAVAEEQSIYLIWKVKEAWDM